MAVTVDSTTVQAGGIGGGVAYTVKNLDLGTYATGGVAITAAILGTGPIVQLLPQPAGGYVPEWDSANAKIKVYWVDTSTDGAPMAEVTTATDLGAASFPCVVIHRL